MERRISSCRRNCSHPPARCTCPLVGLSFRHLDLYDKVVGPPALEVVHPEGPREGPQGVYRTYSIGRLGFRPPRINNKSWVSLDVKSDLQHHGSRGRTAIHPINDMVGVPDPCRRNPCNILLSSDPASLDLFFFWQSASSESNMTPHPAAQPPLGPSLSGTVCACHARYPLLRPKLGASSEEED